jgi:hypothetical protein
MLKIKGEINFRAFLIIGRIQQMGEAYFILIFEPGFAEKDE